jgi:hypothetical protein
MKCISETFIDIIILKQVKIIYVNKTLTKASEISYIIPLNYIIGIIHTNFKINKVKWVIVNINFFM